MEGGFVRGCGGERGILGVVTVQFFENTLHGARAATAGHGDVEFVVMLRHFGWFTI
jgi:hypothetical protein